MTVGGRPELGLAAWRRERIKTSTLSLYILSFEAMGLKPANRAAHLLAGLGFSKGRWSNVKTSPERVFGTLAVSAQTDAMAVACRRGIARSRRDAP
jgi:hypothetical protein